MSRAPLMFHKDFFVPDFAAVPLHEGPVRYSVHAKNVAHQGGVYTQIPLPEVFVAENATLIEVELNPVTGAVEKQVWRQPLNDEYDLCFPMLPDGFIKTVWLNHKKDMHATLNRNKFVTGYQWRCMKNKLKAAAQA